MSPSHPCRTNHAAVALMLGAASLAACGPGLASAGDYATEMAPCDQCLQILVECTSTSQNEQDFVACRDQWLGCHEQHSLGLNECNNPSDTQACDLCRERFLDCKASSPDDAQGCAVGFSVCKAFLVTRPDVAAECSEQVAAPSNAGCAVCQDDFIACLSDSTGQSTLEMCSGKLDACRNANHLAAEQCPAPVGQQACDACAEQLADCLAAGSAQCEAGWQTCVALGAPDTSCSTGSGGEGGGGAGGGAGGPDGCAHSECDTGAPLVPECSPCAATICAEDPYCCDTEWDSMCTAAAQGQCSCA